MPLFSSANSYRVACILWKKAELKYSCIDNSCTILHRSDLNQGSDYIAIFASLISGSGGRKFQNLKSSFNGDFIFLLK